MPNSSFNALLKSLHPNTVLDASITKNDFIALDLSITNEALKPINVSSSTDLDDFIQNYIKKNNAKVAYGGYLEKRGIYQRSTYFNKTNLETERNIHLGLDIWIAANTIIYAPLEGEIHSFKNNTNYGDYGPTILLKHTFYEFQFYTLYGHLSIDSITNLKIGTKVKQGEKLATLGTADVNGDYPPHLHFQVIKHLENYNGDYPGVSNQQDLAFYKANCPDPNLLLKL